MPDVSPTMKHRLLRRRPLPEFPAYRSRLDETIIQRHQRVPMLPLDRAGTRKIDCISHAPASEMQQNDSRRNRRLSFCSLSDKAHIQLKQWANPKWVDKNRD
jgi:hypothetical protein